MLHDELTVKQAREALGHFPKPVDPIICKCFYREDDHCFLHRPGPQATCTAHKPPAKVDPAPIDLEAQEKWRRAGL